MEEQRQLSVTDIIEESLKILSGISVPLLYKKQIMDPMEGVYKNLVIIHGLYTAELQKNNELIASLKEGGNPDDGENPAEPDTADEGGEPAESDG